MIIRPRRNRKSTTVRALVREHALHLTDLVAPLFVVEGKGIKHPIPSLPDVYHFSIDELVMEVESLWSLGIKALLLFGVPDHKDALGSSAYDDHGIVQKAIRAIKIACPDILVITDVCMCQYTDHGHCGILTEDGQVANDPTLTYLSRIAVSHAKAGADVIAPSDMMDGRVLAIRQGLDQAGFSDVSIMAYSIKYASNLYGPFRDAAHSTPSFGDRRSYQMDYHNKREAIREAKLDEAEGADFIMVKPAGMYLDIIQGIKGQTTLPLVAYHVSGEYAMLYQAVETGILDACAISEQMIALKRAGADLIITYFSRYLAEKRMKHYGK